MEQKKYKVILVDDHKLFREGLKFVIMQMDNIEVVAEASNGKEFLEILEYQDADLVLMDIAMPELNGIEATKQALDKRPALKILVLSMFCDEEYYFQMIQAGVMGFVLKEVGKSELEEAITTVLRGESFFSQKLLRDIIMNINNPLQKQKAPAEQKIDLTKRELDDLRGTVKFSDCRQAFYQFANG
ncbi:MAG: response regulator [Bacteroidota bacterium]